MKLTKRSSRMIGVLLATLVICFVADGSSLGGFSAGVIVSGKFSSGTLLLKDTIGGTSCSSTAVAPVSTNQGTCTSTFPMSAAPGSTTTTLSNYGTVTPKAADVTTGTCGVQQLADSSSASDTGIAVGGLTYGGAGPTKYSVTGSDSVTLDGSTGWGETLTGSAGLANYSLMAWVKPTALNGVIIGDTSTQWNTTPTDSDRMIWINTAGRIGFGNDTATLESSAATPISTGTWYFVVVTKSSVTGMDIYINGVSSAVLASAAAEGTLSYSGWWHLGWGNAVGSSFTTLPTTNFFDGSVADMAVFPTVLAGTQISTLYADTTQAALSSATTADGASPYWAMQDTGQTLYTGAIANLAANASDQYGDYSANPGTNYGTGAGTLGSDSSGPIGTTATTFNGSTGYIQTATELASPGPQTFSIAAWFKTSTATGVVVGLANTQNNAPSEWDRMIWLDPTGHVEFGLYTNTTFEIGSSATTSYDYADGKWHYIVVTVTPVNTTTATALMYVDGSLVAGSSGNESTSGNGGDPGQPYAGWWHLGWNNADQGWPDAPTTDYWSGSIGQVAIFPTALTAASVSTLFGESSYSQYAAAVTSGVASSNAYWPLNDTTLPGSVACSYLTFTIQEGTGSGATCIFPVVAGSCPATPPATAWLSAISATIPVAMPALIFDTAVSPGATTVPTDGVGLHVSVPVTITDSSSGFSATLVHGIGYVLL